jgi:hypothetical protein
MEVTAKEFIIIDIEKKFLFEFRKYPVPLFPTLPRLHPVSATRRQAEILCKFYRTCAWRQVAETGCKRGTPENKGTGFGASLHPLGRGFLPIGFECNNHNDRFPKICESFPASVGQN